MYTLHLTDRSDLISLFKRLQPPINSITCSRSKYPTISATKLWIAFLTSTLSSFFTFFSCFFQLLGVPGMDLEAMQHHASRKRDKLFSPSNKILSIHLGGFLLGWVMRAVNGVDVVWVIQAVNPQDPDYMFQGKLSSFHILGKSSFHALGKSCSLCIFILVFSQQLYDESILNKIPSSS